VASRLPGRLLNLRLAAGHRLSTLGRRRRPQHPGRILVCHHLLLGDTVMLAPLLAKLRALHPRARIVMTSPRAFAPLFASRPWDVTALPFDPRRPETLRELAREPGFDLAIVPGDNRFSWTAQALGARWIVAFEGDRPAYKSLPVDELRPWPREPMALGDLFATLVDGPAPPAFEPPQWPAPAHRPFTPPSDAFAVLHVGASSPLKFWPAGRWQALAQALSDRGLAVVFTPGPGEMPLVDAIDPQQRWTRLALDLPQMFALLQRAALLVAPDTGMPHLARVTGTPTVTLFGPGSATLFGPGEFWRDAPWTAVTVSPFPCRDQHGLFKRELPWVVRCNRSPRECPAPRCMEAIGLDAVLEACDRILARGPQAGRDAPVQVAAHPA
jgi:ADP-heptose:LPS heptosyltransferase